MPSHPVQNMRYRNTANNRIANFTEKVMTYKLDGDYYRGTYEDNGETVTKTASMWNPQLWEKINE